MPTTTFERSGGAAWFDALANHPWKRRVQFSGWLQYIPTMNAVFWTNVFVHKMPWQYLLDTIGTMGGTASIATDTKTTITVMIVQNVMAALSTAIIGYDIMCCKYRVRLLDKPVDSNKTRLKGATMLDVMLDRHSARSFHNHPLNDEDKEFVIDLANRSCTEAMDVFALAEDDKRKNDKPTTTTAPAPTIRIVYMKKRLTVWPAINGKEFLVAVAPKEYNRQAVMSVGYAIENVVLRAHQRGIATCIIGPGTDQGSVIEALGPDNFDPGEDHIVLSCALGYESWYIPLFLKAAFAGLSHVRKPLEELFFENAAMTKPIDPAKAPYDQYAKIFEACRWAPSSYNAQPVRAVVRTSSAAADDGDDGADNNGASSAAKVDRVDFYMYGPSRYYGVVAMGIWMRHCQIGCADCGIKGKFVQLGEEERCQDGDAVVADKTFYGWSWIIDGTNK